MKEKNKLNKFWYDNILDQLSLCLKGEGGIQKSSYLSYSKSLSCDT
jgi:hypothetical protein